MKIETAPGTSLPELVFGPITPDMVAEFARQSGDRNPIHLDREFAVAAGLESEIVHGLFTAALMARVITNWAGPGRLESAEMRFLAMTPVGSVVTIRGSVESRFEEDGIPKFRISLLSRRDDGVATVSGLAVVRAP